MMTLIAAALVAAQPTPATDPHAQHSNMPHATGSGMMQHDQHDKMMMDCCKECCEHMKAHEGHMTKGQPSPKGGS